MKTLMICKPGTLDVKQKRKLQYEGYIVVETDTPEDIKIVDSLASLDGHMLLKAALTALRYGNDPTCRNAFGNEVRVALEKLV